MSYSTGGKVLIVNATDEIWKQLKKEVWDISQDIPESVPVDSANYYRYEFKYPFIKFQA
jgi:hypothetical protein